jgi:tetratricopeptide (TPR) repeat protein
MNVKVAYGIALMELARGLIKDKKYSESRPLLRAALKVDPTRTLPYAVDAWRLLCRSYSKQGKAESALYVCTQAHKVSPCLKSTLLSALM